MGDLQGGYHLLIQQEATAYFPVYGLGTSRLHDIPRRHVVQHRTKLL